MKIKKYTIAKILHAALLVFMLFAMSNIYLTRSAYAQNSQAIKSSVTKAAGCGNALNPCAQKAPVAYGGVESSIRTYLCVPNSGGDKAPSVDPTTGVTIGGTTYGARATNNTDGGDLVLCVNRLYRFGAAIGSFAAVFFIALAGYYYIVAGESGKTRAKATITSVIAGLVIIFGAFIFLKQINPNLTQFRSIQPPQLTGVPKSYPSCVSVDFGTDCLQPDGTVGSSLGVQNGTLPHGLATACKGGIISTPASLNHDPGASQICKDLADVLAGLQAKLPSGVRFLLYSSISGTHDSSCHSPGNDNSGNCVDIDLVGDSSANPDYHKDNGGSSNPKWGDLCKAIASLGHVNFANEASNTTACQQIKAYAVTRFTSGPNLHVNYIGQ